MSALTVIGVGLLGGFGAIARFVIDGAVAGRLATDFPVGTLAVNLTGAFVLGVIAGATTSETVAHLVATGLIGSYTTFSTWMFESHRLAEDGEPGLAMLNFAVSLVLGVALAWAGSEIGAML